MKNKIQNILFLGVLLFAFSCNKKLDTTPKQSIDEKDALKTPSDVQVALVGAYADMGGGDVYGGRAFLNPDLLGDNNELTWTGTFAGMTQIKNKAIPVDNGFVRDTWLFSYAAINDVNNVLSALDVVTVQATKDRTEGEAKFIRGSMLFDLVRLFAKAYNDGNPANNEGVPIVTTPTRGITDADKRPRNKVSEVYAQVIQDLADAEAKLPASNGFFANKYAAAAMLARVYLQKGDYANARDAANRVIAGGAYSLRPTYAGAFPNALTAPVSNTSEDIFAMQVTLTQGTNSFFTFYSSSSRGDIQIRPEHLALYETGDARKTLFYTSGGSTYTGKHESRYGNVHVLRLAEMYLIRAEANFRLGTSVGATPDQDLNRIRQRVGLPAKTGATLNDILSERKLELMFEGFTLHDIKRLQGSVGLLPWNSPKLIYPIPQRERNANPNLSQNEGY
jgi:hypothetical protein